MGKSGSDRSVGGPPPTEVRSTEPQRRYLERGLAEPGGKLPRFDREGRQAPRKAIEACMAHDWVEPWTANPPDNQLVSRFRSSPSLQHHRCELRNRRTRANSMILVPL